MSLVPASFVWWPRADQSRGDLTKINVKPGDWGGQFDSAEHHPDGAKVFGGADKKEASSWVVRNLPFFP